MTPSRDPETTRLAVRILSWQGGIALGLAALCAAGFGWSAGKSAFAGGAIGLIANLYMTFAALRPATGAGLALGRLYVGQLVKVGLTVAMLYSVARTPWVVWPALIGGYVAMLMVFWIVPAVSAPRLPPRSRQPSGEARLEQGQQGTDRN
jgi:F0F1-type ATP synthase assembly protein I